MNQPKTFVTEQDFRDVEWVGTVLCYNATVTFLKILSNSLQMTVASGLNGKCLSCLRMLRTLKSYLTCTEVQWDFWFARKDILMLIREVRKVLQNLQSVTI